MSIHFKSTPRQAGHAIGLAVANLAQKLSGGINPSWLQEAELSRAHYESELLLLTAAAAMHTVESCGLTPEVENEVAAGLFSWVHELPVESRELLLRSLDDATDYYSQAAASTDAEQPFVPNEISEIEAAFGDRLLNSGENNEVRGKACLRLCVVIPKTLWSIQVTSTRQMLRDALLLLPQ
ncbi:hypothetical protein [Piscinibacter sp.]|uniref:hypothetical protein n=1 Tax=Piscinibacter sp. TaxID=1903157 RepID=UPI0039E282D7